MVWNKEICMCRELRAAVKVSMTYPRVRRVHSIACVRHAGKRGQYIFHSQKILTLRKKMFSGRVLFICLCGIHPRK
jgi:hypothetical protein